MKWMNVALVAALLAASGASYAHGNETHPAANDGPVKKVQKPWGIAGEAKDAKRTIQIKMLDAGGELGKRLDFLLQELNREANTMLSKTTGGDPGIGLRLTTIGLELKAEIERAREQVQNLE